MYNKKLKSFLRDYFTLTSRERGGALTLASVILIQLGILFFLNFRPPAPVPEVREHAMLLKKFENKKQIQMKAEKSSVKQLFPFDPNIITDEQWQKLGMTAKQTSVIRNYLSKGGRFRKKQDVAKMYVISKEQYSELEPYIQINETAAAMSHPAKEFKKEKRTVQVDLNSADTLQLATLPLIGAGRARMIFKYREALGGFYSGDQLLEVFSLDSSVVQTILPHVIIHQEKIRKLNLNNDTIRHPYLTRKQSLIISSFRKQHGNFNSLEDVKRVTVLSDETIGKLAPYLVFE